VSVNFVSKLLSAAFVERERRRRRVWKRKRGNRHLFLVHSPTSTPTSPREQMGWFDAYARAAISVQHGIRPMGLDDIPGDEWACSSQPEEHII
jgi:hypothetical protein